MLSLDTLRPDQLGWRSGEDTTPHLDALLASSFVMDNHRSCSNWTYSSVVCVQASRRPVQSGFLPNVSALEVIPDDLVLGSQLLQDAGWQTALLSANPFFSDQTHLDRGFDRAEYAYLPANLLSANAVDAIEGMDPGRPWYVQVHYVDPHEPYNPPDEYLRGLEDLPPIAYNLSTHDGLSQLTADWPTLSWAARRLIQEHLGVYYRGELSFLDAEIGWLLERLESRGDLEDTLVVLWTDHGEQLFEHGAQGHGKALYLEEADAIAALRAPGLAPARWTGPTTHVDIWPTILDALDGAPDDGGALMGVTAGGRPADDHRFALQYVDLSTRQVIERGGVRMHYLWQPPGERLLYRVGDDPDERVDVYDAADPEVIALWDLLTPEIEALLTVGGDLPLGELGP